MVSLGGFCSLGPIFTHVMVQWQTITYATWRLLSLSMPICHDRTPPCRARGRCESHPNAEGMEAGLCMAARYYDGTVAR